MSNPTIEEEQAYYDRQDWLLEHGVASSDVMEDERGEYIIVRYEQEDYSIIDTKVYLPAGLNIKL